MASSPEKLIVTAALTGSVPTKKDNPNLPVTPVEIAQSARRCFEAGAAIVHIHARDPNSKPTLSPEIFTEIYEKIQATTPELIVQISTGGRAGSDRQLRAASVLKLRPEMASLTTGSINFADQIYENSNETVAYLAQAEKEAGAKSELEIFDTGMICLALSLYERGLIEAPLYFNFVLGLPGSSQPATPKQLLHLTESIPPGSLWNVSAIGRHQLPMTTLGIILGGNVRVGLEDNLFYKKGELATNERLIDRVVRLALEFGRPIASPDDARAILHLKPRRQAADDPQLTPPLSFTGT